MWNGGITSTSGRGRGSSVDRGGRGGRGRGASFTHHLRGVGFEDSGDGNRIEAQTMYSVNNSDFKLSYLIVTKLSYLL